MGSVMVHQYRHPELVSGPLEIARLPHDILKQVQDDDSRLDDEFQGGNT
jgi:hypothetical protein